MPCAQNQEISPRLFLSDWLGAESLRRCSPQSAASAWIKAGLICWKGEKRRGAVGAGGGGGGYEGNGGPVDEDVLDIIDC